MRKIKFVTFIVLVTALSLPAFAQTPYLVDRQTGKYLGNLSKNKFDPDSVSNPYGRYGSKYSPDSINNEYGRYGSRYSSDSARNPYATNPPAIVSPRGNRLGDDLPRLGY